MTTTNDATGRNTSEATRWISPPSSAMSRVLAGITVPDTPVIALAVAEPPLAASVGRERALCRLL